MADGDRTELQVEMPPRRPREVRQSHPHDSAMEHVSGRARYVDDVPEPQGLLHLAFGQSTEARAEIVSMDLSAVRAAPGVVGVWTASDLRGKNDVSPFAGDEPLLAVDAVDHHGQPIFLVAAEDFRLARQAARLGKIEYAPRSARVTIAQARAAEDALEPAQRMGRGDVDADISTSAHRIEGEIEVGGQEHFYLEGQVAMATPAPDGPLHILSSTQHPTEVQHLAAAALGRPDADVVVEVRRMGGAFGGKETQAAAWAVACAVVADQTGRPAKMRLDRDDDMVMTGKRHDFEARYDVGFDDAGRIEAIRVELASRCGATFDLSAAINDRAMFHVDNCYYLPTVEILSHRFRTHTVSNTAFRGFGGPQGMLVIERVMDHVAAILGLDPLEVRKSNLYGEGRDETPYGWKIPDNVAPPIIEALEARARYLERRAEVAAFNAKSSVIKKGIALTPVRFGISFTTTHLNQAGALVMVYADGSILLNHGGTEMGQGLMVKVRQVVADAFGVEFERVRLSSTRTDKVPNTSATAASSGTDLNGMAAHLAATEIRDRMAAFAAERWKVEPESVSFEGGAVHGPGVSSSFEELCKLAYLGRVSLASSGFYATPDIDYDRAAHRGRPFFYNAYGAAVAEVAVDTLTGEHRVLAVDILHDVGKSLNPAIDLGQIEGGFVQGMGWLTTEELVYADDGRLLSHAPSTYKIPTANDRPARMDIELWPEGENPAPTIHRSKAVGEPPFMLALSVFSALTEAVRAASPEGAMPALDAPATPERILAALDSV